MTRRLTLLFSAFEAVLVAGIGLAIPLVPLTILWAVQYGFAPDWLIVWRVAADSWLVGHGVDITVTLDPQLAAALGQTGAEPLRITLAALGFALLTVLLGARAGRRIAETGHRLLGMATAVVVFAVISTLVAFSALLADARVSLWQSAILPACVLLLGIGASVVSAEIDDAADGIPERRISLRAWVATWPPRTRGIAGGVLRTGLGSAATVVGLSSVTLAVLIGAHYVDLIRLYENLHGDWAGGLALTVGQLALLPDAVIWTASWFVGPGFAIGVGSHVSPLGTALGPLPAVPLLGAVPTGSPAFGFVGLVVPVVAGFLAAVGARHGLRSALAGRPSVRALALVAAGGGALSGLVLGLSAWAASGSAGPGRLSQVGPDPLAVGLWAAIESAVAIGIGLAATQRGAGGAPLPESTRESLVDGGPDTRLDDSAEAARRPAPHQDDVDTAPVPVVGSSPGRGPAR